MYKLHFLKKENDLNKIIKKQRRDKSRLNILFTSLWDKHSTNLVEQLKEKYQDNETGLPLYIVDSFHMPHSYVIYNTTKLPHLVKLKRDGLLSEDYLPLVMEDLKLTKTKLRAK
jgi:hypothetical protein|tara:strand:- start:73 stop:414 length:342 start_codon:yes stop_codon:yes gene_type:complete